MEALEAKSEKDEKVRLRDRNRCIKFLIDNWFMLSTIAGVALGFGLGFVIRTTQPGPTAITWIGKDLD